VASDISIQSERVMEGQMDGHMSAVTYIMPCLCFARAQPSKQITKYDSEIA